MRSCGASAPIRPTATVICDVGLWGWSRHPNYFFEWFGWLAYPLLAIDLGGAYPWGFVALAGPVCMYWLLVHVSGIPPLEAHMLERRRDEFRAYQARTNAFFPAPPRSHLRELHMTLRADDDRLSAKASPWPDAVTQAAINLLVGRTRRQLVAHAARRRPALRRGHGALSDRA